jgi:hypothetical protein
VKTGVDMVVGQSGWDDGSIVHKSAGDFTNCARYS